MILVTGGDGFLGNHLVDHLRLKKKPVIYTTRNKNLAHLKDSEDKLFIDFSKNIDANKISHKFDTIIHTVGISQNDCRNDLTLATAVNTNSTIELAKIAVKKSIKKFIYLSTVHVYGKNLKGNIDENSHLNPFDNYSSSKLNTEIELIKIFRNTEVNLIILRLSNVFGAPLNYDANIWHLIGPHLCKQAIFKKKMELLSNGKQVRDFLGINDFLNIISELTVKDFNKCNVIYNCGSGMPITINNFAKLIKTRYHKLFSEDVELFLGSDDSDKSDYNFNVERLMYEVGISLKNNISEEIDIFLKFIYQQKS